jgi:hypothetical protein
MVSDVVAFTNFMRFLAPPTPSNQGIPGNPSGTSIQNGQALFSKIHCNQSVALSPTCLCTIWAADSRTTSRKAPRGRASSAPRRYGGSASASLFLHDGRATPANGGLMLAIEQHADNGSEANTVSSLFNNSLSDSEKQELLNFLRSL